MRGLSTRLSRRDALALMGSFGLTAAVGCSSTSTPRPAPSTSQTTWLPSLPVADPVGSLVTRWRADQFSLGSYSYLAKGAMPDDRSTLRAPVRNRLVIAGEATDTLAPATVQGALRSGRRAAFDLLDVMDGDRVCVIGAGIAGLTAANLLVEDGRTVEMFEARGRVGGRIWTDDSLGFAADLGASWIHGVSGNRLTDIAEANGLERVATDYDNARVRTVDGRVLPEAEIPQWYREALDAQLDLGADLSDLSSGAFSEGARFFGGDVLFKDGYRGIIDAIAGSYRLDLNSPVEAVIDTGDSLEIVVGGEVHTFDGVVVTVPLGVLKAGSVAFEPPLPVEHLAAIDRLGMGLLNKVYLRFEEQFWDPEADILGYVGDDRGRFSWWVNHAKATGEPVLAAFNGGSEAEEIETWSDADVVAAAMSVLRNMFE